MNLSVFYDPEPGNPPQSLSACLGYLPKVMTVLMVWV